MRKPWRSPFKRRACAVDRFCSRRELISCGKSTFQFQSHLICAELFSVLLRQVWPVKSPQSQLTNLKFWLSKLRFIKSGGFKTAEDSQWTKSEACWLSIPVSLVILTFFFLSCLFFISSTSLGSSNMISYLKFCSNIEPGCMFPVIKSENSFILK